MFSRRLKELRLSNNLTQDGLAEKLSISRSALSLYELGKREPDFDTLCSISKFFNVSVDYLLGNTLLFTEKDTKLDEEIKRTSEKANEIISNDIETLSPESKKELEKYIQLLKLKDTIDKSKGEMSSHLTPDVSKGK